MNRVFVVANSIVSPLGLTAGETFAAVASGITGLQKSAYPFLQEQTYTSAFTAGEWKSIEASLEGYRTESRFEQILLKPVLDVMKFSGVIPSDKGVLPVFATTKGAIDRLDMLPEERLQLHHSAKNVAAAIGFVNEPVVVSNACISGLSAMIVAMRMLQAGHYHTAIVAGADVLGHFIVSGFDSLLAMSPERCRPFDKDRQGINLGEGGAAVVLTVKERGSSGDVVLLGGSITNDANHVSAPSRTGEELAFTIRQALEEAGMGPEDLSFVSAHGTATLYNDEMEAKALNMAGVALLPTHSLKGYFGHTLGAAGLLESIVCFHSLLDKRFIGSLGYREPGTTRPVNICTEPFDLPVARAALKTMAGFGGCNAALVFAVNAR